MSQSEPRQRDPQDPLYDPNDKWNEYKVDFHANETHAPDEWDPKTEGKIHKNVTKTRFWISSVMITLVHPCVRCSTSNIYKH